MNSTPMAEPMPQPTSLVARGRRYINQGGPVQRRLELGLVALMSATLLALGNGMWRPTPRIVVHRDVPELALVAKAPACDDPQEMTKLGEWLDTFEVRTETRRFGATAGTAAELEGYAACVRKATERPGNTSFLQTAASVGRVRTVTWLLGTATFHESDLDRAVLAADAHPAVSALLRAKGAHSPTLPQAAQRHAAIALQAALAQGNYDPSELSPALDVFLQTNVACATCTDASYAQEELRAVGLLFAKGAKLSGVGLAALCARGTAMTDAHLETALRSHTPGAIEGALGNLDASVPEAVARRIAAEGIDWGYRDGEDDAAMPLVQAVSTRNEDLVRLLVELGAPVARVYKDGSSALQAAVACSDGETGCGRITELLLAHGADANRRFPDGVTPLFAAAEGGNGRVIRALLDHGARLETRVLRETALNAAERQGNTLAARILAARGAQVPPQMP